MAHRNEPLFVQIIGAPWWVGISLAVILYLASFIVKHTSLGNFHFENALSVILRFFAAAFALGGIISFLISLAKGTLFNKTKDLADIKSMRWQQFEFLVGEYYRRKGYSVTEAGGNSPDGGIDLVAQKNGEKIVVQCKHWKAYKVDVKVARELYGVMVDATASRAVLITSGSFTQPAFDFVVDKPIDLIDGPKLAKLIADVRSAQQAQKPPQKSRAVLIPTDPPPLQAKPETRDTAFHQETPVCPHCKKPMVLRTAHKGPHPGSKFWGCSNYPACRQTQPYQTIP